MSIFLKNEANSQYFSIESEIFTSVESETELNDDAAEKYEKIFEEIQNYEIADSALDKIEEVLDENLKLKQDKIEMRKQIQDLQASVDAQNFKNINESIKKRQSNQLILEELKPNTILNSFIGKPNNIPPPPPSTPFLAYKPKYRLVFWAKIENNTNTVFENLLNYEIKQAAINKFPFVLSKNISNDQTLPVNKHLLDHKREIAITSVLRLMAMTPNTVINKLSTFSKDLCEDIDKIRALYRVLPNNEEIKTLTSAVSKGIVLSQNENFIYNLSQIPNLQILIDSIYFKLSFDNVITELLICFENWNKAITKLMQNKRLKEFLHLVLCFGNELNSNHQKYGNAKGFKLGFLNELEGIKSSVENCSLFEVLVEDYFFRTGNPHIFSHSEHVLLKEIANSSFKTLIESHNQFYQDYCKLASVVLPEDCERNIRDFVNKKRKDVEYESEVFNEAKKSLKACHQYFGDIEEYDDEGRLSLFKIISKFYDSYADILKRKWGNVSNRDSKRATIIENKRKSSAKQIF